MTLGSGGGREYFYDTETTRVLDDFRGLEEQGDFSEKCDEALRLFSLHLQPIVEVYFQKDMGDDRMFIVKAKPWTEKDFVSLLQKHVRSFTNAEWPLPGYFERHARQLEMLTCRRGGPGSTSVEALQYLSVSLLPTKIEIVERHRVYSNRSCAPSSGFFQKNSKPVRTMPFRKRSFKMQNSICAEARH